MVRNAAKDQITTVSNEMLDLISMRDRSKSHPNELSGGAQQKVAVGRAIATGSHFFLLDEPLGALDALVRAELRYELRRLASDLGLTVIHVTHDQEEALSIADRVVVMKRGTVMEVGRPAELYHSPKNIFTENFVGETNLLEGKILEANGTDYVVEVRGQRIRMLASARTVGQRVVVAIRPEFVPLVSAKGKGNEWRGRVKEVAFLGSINRYIVELRNGLDIVAHIPTVAERREFQVGDDVNVQMGSGEHTLLFDYPEKGLEKETALE
jgi:ABC-type Fe3+/spermidine/putrescine transport system ATPase subunit